MIPDSKYGAVELLDTRPDVQLDLNFRLNNKFPIEKVLKC